MEIHLGTIFSAIVYKELAQVDLPGGSHQHELNGDNALQLFFDTLEQRKGTINWHFFADDKEPLKSQGNYTFYDARKKSFLRTGRSEWRMYYGGEFLANANPGDVLLLARSYDNQVYGLVFQANSGWFRSARILFGIDEIEPNLKNLDEKVLEQQDLEFIKKQILGELGIDVELPVTPKIEDIAIKELNRAKKNKLPFPKTGKMSELARSLVKVDLNKGDEALLAWLDKEEELFRAIEKILVQQKLNSGFESVDDFISYSLSVQNRRKSRMGYALQNHLGYLFDKRGLKFETQKTTEGKNKPDFLFPSSAAYHDEKYNTELLLMLAAKSSCKERWRQILTEAKRIEHKHLCTLEQTISVAQTDEMKIHKVILVLPQKFHSTYTTQQQRDLWTVDQFINTVKEKQTAI